MNDINDFPQEQGPLTLDNDLEPSGLQQLIGAVKEVSGNDYLYLDKAVRAKTTTFSAPFSVWAVCVSPENRLYVMDGSQQWHEVEDRPEDGRIITKLLKFFHQ